MKYILSIVFLLGFTTISLGQTYPEMNDHTLVHSGKTIIPDAIQPGIKNRVLANTDTTIIPVDTQLDSVNISQMVTDQVNAIRKKRLEEAKKQITVTYSNPEKETGQIKASLSNEWNDFFNMSVSPFINKIKNTFSSSEVLTNKITILSSASLIAFLVIIIRRKMFKRKYSKKNLFKDNIRLLRDEKVVNRTNSKLTEIRNSLVNHPSFYSTSQSGISKVAKELNIAKGEVLLAAKIKSHELNKSWLEGSNIKTNWRII